MERRREDDLSRSLEETLRGLAAARAGFEETADPDLMEYYLYGICALGARHTCLLRLLRGREGKEEEG